MDCKKGRKNICYYIIINTITLINRVVNYSCNYRQKGDDHREIVLNFIIERKNINDLLQSIIKNKRYIEQKRRLNSSGIDRLIYLVEGDVREVCNQYL